MYDGYLFAFIDITGGVNHYRLNIHIPGILSIMPACVIWHYNSLVFFSISLEPVIVVLARLRNNLATLACLLKEA